jgi:hypothetical protein
LGANALYHATSTSVRSYLSVRFKRALRARRAAREAATAQKAAVLPGKPVRELPPLLPPRALHQHHGVESGPPDSEHDAQSPNTPSSKSNGPRDSVLTLDTSLPAFGGASLSPVAETPTHGDMSLYDTTAPSSPIPVANSPSVIVHRDMVFTEPLSEAQQLALGAANAGAAPSTSNLPQPFIPVPLRPVPFISGGGAATIANVTDKEKKIPNSPYLLTPNGNGTSPPTIAVSPGTRHKRLATVANTGTPLIRKIVQKRYSIVVQRNREKQRVREEQGI